MNSYTSTLNYLGSDINTTWQTPSKRSYIVSSDNRTFAVHPDDIAWFLTRTVRGKLLFAIVEVAPTPQLVVAEIAETLPFTVVEEAPQIQTSDIVEVVAIEPTEEPTERKRTRKSKVSETQDPVME